MTKSQLIALVAKETGITKKNVTAVCNTLLSRMEESLAEGEDVMLSGFGTFTVNTVAEHCGRNPQTGAPVQVPASKRVGFTAGKSLKEKLDET